MGDIRYTPRGLTGYVCVITSNRGRSMRLTREQLEGDPDVDGDDELCNNKSALRSLDAYAASELARRRARQKIRKNAFAK